MNSRISGNICDQHVEIVASNSPGKLLEEGLSLFPMFVAGLVFPFPHKKVTKSAYFRSKIAVN